MDFDVSVGDSSAVMDSDAAPSSAGLQAREEYAKIMSDPTHPMFEPFKRRDPAAEAYIDGLYKNAYPATLSHTPESVSIGGPVPTQPGETEEQAADRTRNDLILAPLRQDWGSAYDARMSGAGLAARALFGAEGWGEVFEDLGATIRQHYGPAGETAALRFLDALADIKTNHGGY
ncbi:MAG: hypothetical protein E8D46_13030 [Nitrospira sp.]|nr:MAG: hypothetical protein E8D46_13030 [Nitrospira sp.]